MATAKCDEGDQLILTGKPQKGKFAHAMCVLTSALCVCWCHEDPEINQLRQKLLTLEGK